MKQNKPIKTRNYHAQNAWFRSSAGPIKDAKKQADKNSCRDFEDDNINSKLIGLDYLLRGFELDNLIEEIKLNPTPTQIEKIVGPINNYNYFPLTPEQIMDIFNIEVDQDLFWFFETDGIYE